MPILSFPERHVPPDLRVQVVALQQQAWPSDGPADPAPWHDPLLDPISVVLLEGGRVLSALDILSKDIRHGGETYSASGLSAVVADERVRGKGYGRRIVSAAREIIAGRGSDLGIFTCDGHFRAFYEDAGWEYLPGTVLIGGTPEEPFPSDRLDKVTLASFFSPKARAAAATFVGARVELYPGVIDKLW